jgi:hypothetical protein
MSLSKYTASYYNVNKYQYLNLSYTHTHIYFPNTQEKTVRVAKIVQHQWETFSSNPSSTKYLQKHKCSRKMD